MNSFVVLALLLGAASAVELSVYDPDACVLLTDPPITRVIDASSPVVFATPGFNFSDPSSVYPPNTICQWSINTAPGAELQLSFFNLTLEESTDCAEDYLQIYDSIDDSATGFITLCGDVGQAGPYIATGTDMFVRFESNDDAEQGVGFISRAGYPVEVTACDAATRPQEFTSPAGFFATENYPVNYGNNVLCQYLFTAPAGQVVEVSFEDADIEECCTCDFLAAYAGNSAVAPKLAHWYGNGKPCKLRSSGNELFLSFQTDFSVTGAGFLGSWRFI